MQIQPIWIDKHHLLTGILTRHSYSFTLCNQAKAVTDPNSLQWHRQSDQCLAL